MKTQIYKGFAGILLAGLLSVSAWAANPEDGSARHVKLH